MDRREQYPYTLICGDQSRRWVWSRHSTLELARREARRRARRLPTREFWVRHPDGRLEYAGELVEVSI